MLVTDMTNLFVGHNEKENFTVLICASDETEAASIAEKYRTDLEMDGEFDITEFYQTCTTFDCDYILTKETKP